MSNQLQNVKPITEGDNHKVVDNPLVKLEESFDFMELSKIYEENQDRVIESDSDIDQIKKILKPVTSMRTGIEKSRKEINEPINKIKKVVDSRAKELTALVVKVETTLKGKVTEYEERKKQEILDKQDSIANSYKEDIDSATELSQCTDLIVKVSSIPNEYEGQASIRWEQIKGRILQLITEKQNQIANAIERRAKAAEEKLEENNLKVEEPTPETKPTPVNHSIDEGLESLMEEEKVEKSEEDEFHLMELKYDAGHYHEYGEWLNTCPRSSIYKFLVFLRQNRDYDRVMLTEAIRFLK